MLGCPILSVCRTPTLFPPQFLAGGLCASAASRQSWLTQCCKSIALLSKQVRAVQTGAARQEDRRAAAGGRRAAAAAVRSHPQPGAASPASVWVVTRRCLLGDSSAFRGPSSCSLAGALRGELQQLALRSLADINSWVQRCLWCAWVLANAFAIWFHSLSARVHRYQWRLAAQACQRARASGWTCPTRASRTWGPPSSTCWALRPRRTWFPLSSLRLARRSCGLDNRYKPSWPLPTGCALCLCQVVAGKQQGSFKATFLL